MNAPETYRTCAMQTAPQGERRAGASHGSDVRAPLNTLHHSPRPSTHEDRDVVTPANDLLYTMAWVHLAHGPMLLTVPASSRHPGRYFVLPLYDAYTENFENLGPTPRARPWCSSGRTARCRNRSRATAWCVARPISSG